ncbi:DUF2290 domain-containing protein [Qipengyuania gaetbuli]|uniref:DUF2290 domain-containing protein n=1 Tax=Qipengyuania gaetbuli TaxID=266952 RepID=UPI0039AEB182
MKIGQIVNQINDIISTLVKEGLSDHQTFPSQKTSGEQTLITIGDSPDLSVSLRDLPYHEVYHALRSSVSYHIRMLDGGLIQFLYTFEKGSLAKHRLALFPSPILEIFDSDPELYMKDELFADIVGKHSVKFPVRFDFSADPKDHKDPDHPRSHLTLGQYKGCRIPVQAPLTPYRFIQFVLRNFYNSVYFSCDFDKRAIDYKFSDSITEGERNLSFISFT